MDLTVAEGLDLLSQVCSAQMPVKGKAVLNLIPEPRKTCRALLNAADITLLAIRNRGVNAATKKKLPSRRLKR